MSHVLFTDPRRRYSNKTNQMRNLPPTGSGRHRPQPCELELFAYRQDDGNALLGLAELIYTTRGFRTVASFRIVSKRTVILLSCKPFVTSCPSSLVNSRAGGHNTQEAAVDHYSNHVVYAVLKGRVAGQIHLIRRLYRTAIGRIINRILVIGTGVVSGYVQSCLPSENLQCSVHNIHYRHCHAGRTPGKVLMLLLAMLKSDV